MLSGTAHIDGMIVITMKRWIPVDYAATVVRSSFRESSEPRQSPIPTQKK